MLVSTKADLAEQRCQHPDGNQYVWHVYIAHVFSVCVCFLSLASIKL